MASIVSSLDEEKEKRLQSLFSQPVRFHLLYKSSHHGANIGTLLSKFDTSGKFVLAVFLQSGDVRGGFTSKSLKVGREFDDEEAFVFEINEKAKRFPVAHSAKAVVVHFTDSDQSSKPATTLGGGFTFGSASCEKSNSLFGQPTITSPSPPSPVAVSFGRSLHLYLDNRVMCVNFCSDLTYSCGWPGEKSVRCADVELHRVQGLGDFLPNPWRELSWTDETRQSLRENFVSFKLILETLPRVRALLLGPVGSGKSSLINSIRSTMYRRIMHLPNVGTATGSFTKKLKSYDIRAEKGASPTALSLCDVTAIGDEDFTGLSLSDTLTVIKGHVPEGYQFQSDFPINDKISGYRAAPTLKDQIHCVLFVLDASKVTSYSSSLRTTLRKLHATVSDLGIPHLILLTHVDQVCCAVKEDVKYVYSSRTLQEKMQKAAELVGLPLSYVLPVKNYISQLSVDLNTDILLLSAVNSILQAVDDTLEDQYPAFQSDFPINDKISGYRAAPTLKDQIHCVLFVLDASKVTSYSSSLRTTLRKLHATVSDLGIPHLILLTHVDQVCCAVKEDVKYVYSSRTLQEKMQKAAELVGLPLSYVLPVKNYISQLSVDLNTDILLLSAVNSILQAVDDTLEDQYPAVITEPHTQTPPNSSIGVAAL